MYDMILKLPHGYYISIMSHAWGAYTVSGDPVGYYDTLAEAVNAASEHYARKLIATEHQDATIADAADIVTGAKYEFYAAMRKLNPEDML